MTDQQKTFLQIASYRYLINYLEKSLIREIVPWVDDTQQRWALIIKLLLALLQEEDTFPNISSIKLESMPTLQYAVLVLSQSNVSPLERHSLAAKLLTGLRRQLRYYQQSYCVPIDRRDLNVVTERKWPLVASRLRNSMESLSVKLHMVVMGSIDLKEVDLESEMLLIDLYNMMLRACYPRLWSVQTYRSITNYYREIYGRLNIEPVRSRLAERITYRRKFDAFDIFYAEIIRSAEAPDVDSLYEYDRRVDASIYKFIGCHSLGLN